MMANVKTTNHGSYNSIEKVNELLYILSDIVLEVGRDQQTTPPPVRNLLYSLTCSKPTSNSIGIKKEMEEKVLEHSSSQKSGFLRKRKSDNLVVIDLEGGDFEEVKYLLFV